jgi:hypothetical protein
MLELADVFRTAGPAYRQAHEGVLLPSHRRALQDITDCRTNRLGGALYACDQCGAREFRYHSCRNRHCPKCQEDRAQQWLELTRRRLLPCDHYLLTFTLPQQLRAVARAHQRCIYSMLLRQAAATVLTFARDPDWIGGTPAILAVLHTWSRTLDFHPHAHLLVSAGGLSADESAWIRPAHPRFLMPGFALSSVFRARMRDALVRAGLTREIDASVWSKSWNVHVQQIGTGEQATRYLSRYVYRVALTNDRLVGFHHEQVTFRYTHARTHQNRQLTLPADRFIARFLQHVLPRGFSKVRSYGLLSPSRRRDLERARDLLQLHSASDSTTAPSPDESPTNAARDSSLAENAATTNTSNSITTLCCPACQHGQLILLERFHRARAPP